jgi:hypothetical protein
MDKITWIILNYNAANEEISITFQKVVVLGRKALKNCCAIFKVAPYNFWNMTKSWFRFNFLKRGFLLEDKNCTSLRAGPRRLRAARRKEGLHGTIGFLGSGVRIETQASDWLTLLDKITKNSKCKQQHFELYSF